MARRWYPGRVWDGEDAYVVGGGPSLRGFDWDLLRGRRVVGCNSAFTLGPSVVSVVVFADVEWWRRVGERGTAAYGGPVVGCNPRLSSEPCPWLLTMERQDHGLGRTRLGFNRNTGSLAINLALVLGARRVHLLGFDLALGEGGRANWHDLRHERASAEVFGAFAAGFAAVAGDLPRVFPGAEVWNVTDGSALDAFPKVSPAAHFGRGPSKESRT